MKPKQLLGTACFLAALLTSSSLFAQVKVGSNPTTIGSNSNLEVEAANGSKTLVDKAGKVTIQDGTQGAGKVLTSDANGVASWQIPGTQSSEVLLSVQLTTAQNITGSNMIVYNVKNFDKGNNFTLPSTFTAPSDGYYLLSISGTSAPQPLSRNARNIRFTVAGSTNYSRWLTDNGVEANDGYTATGTAIIALKKGDTITTTAGAGGWSYILNSVYLQIMKVSN